jgi:hypothetical protein
MHDHTSEIAPDTDKTCALCGVTLPKGSIAIRELNYSAEPWESWRCVDERGCKLRQEVLKDEPSYGYEIVTTLGRLGPLAAGENTVYPLLRRLKAERDAITRSFAAPDFWATLV